MRIAFIDFGEVRFDPTTVDSTPLGGTESAVCYLSRALARQNQDVFLFNKTTTPGIHAGVTCFARDHAPLPASLHLDATVCVGTPANVPQLRSMLGPTTRLFRWVHLGPDQPSVAALKNPAEQSPYDAIIVVSDWQRDQFHQHFGIDPARMVVLKNGIGFPFENLFPPGQSILSAKQWPPVLCYASAPYRGLDILLDAFPAIRAAVLGTRLKVFSSLTLYGYPSDQDESTFGNLYARCRQTEGIEYHGAVTQPQLAHELRDVSLLTYPNHVAETFCIVALEAMASGCRVITSNFGALPETTAGFARLISSRTRDEYLQEFISQTIQALTQQARNPQEVESFLRRQIDFVNQTATWDIRAKEWTTWLQSDM